MKNSKDWNIGFNKKTIYWLLEKGDSEEDARKFVDYFLIACILINVLCTILETVPSFDEKYGRYFKIVDLTTVGIFSVEYILRIWCSVLDPTTRHPFWGRLSYIRSPLAIIDLLAILPFYLPLFITLDINILGILRLFRLVRLIKLFRYSESAVVFRDVYRLKKNELQMVLMAILFVMVLSSAVVFYFENEAQPDKFSSIPAAMWWAMATLTTVGYGDIYPITNIGKLFASFIAILGIGMVALPSGILGSGFVVILRRKGGGTFKCPHCNGKIERGKVKL